MSRVSHVEESARAHFDHEVTFYAGPGDRTRSILPFVREGIAQHEPVLVALLPEANQALESALGVQADRVDFVDISELGANPARIIPEWRRFLRDHAATGPVRGVGEPAWPGRRDVEVAEAELHESLLNLAFEDGPPWRLLCPYDSQGLSREVLDEARRNHPGVLGDDLSDLSIDYAGSGHAHEVFTAPLPPAPDNTLRVAFGSDDLGVIRSMVRRVVEGTRLSEDAGDDLILAAHEVATNSVLHGGGKGELLIWDAESSLVIEVVDDGCIEDPLVGRGLPDLLPEHGRGIWMANQLCDLVQVRSGRDGTQVRLHAWT